MALAIDTSIKGTTSGSSGSITTPGLTTAGANELLIAFCGGDGSTGVGDGHVTNITGGPGGWAEVNRANSQTIAGGNNWNGWASIWWTFAPTKLTAATFTMTFSAGPGWILIVAFTGADTVDAIGASNIAGAASGAPSKSLVTTKDNSWVWGTIWDWSNNVTPTIPANQTQQDIFNDTTSGDSGWTQYVTLTTPSTGTSVTINDTAPTADNWNLCMVEILPAIVVISTPAMGFESDFQWLGGDWR